MPKKAKEKGSEEEEEANRRIRALQIDLTHGTLKTDTRRGAGANQLHAPSHAPFIQLCLVVVSVSAHRLAALCTESIRARERSSPSALSTLPFPLLSPFGNDRFIDQASSSFFFSFSISVRSLFCFLNSAPQLDATLSGHCSGSHAIDSFSQILESITQTQCVTDCINK